MRYILDISRCEFLGKGHEGSVYLTPEGYALKIFYKSAKASEEAKILEITKDSVFFPNLIFIAHNMVLREYVSGITLKEYLKSQKLTYNLSIEIINLVEDFKKMNFKRINIRNAHIFIDNNEKLKVIDPRKIFSKNTPYPKDIVKILDNSHCYEDFLKHVIDFKPQLLDFWIKSYDYYSYFEKRIIKINMYA